MAHHISGIIGPVDELIRFSREKGLHRPASLVGDLGFLPLSDKHLDHLFPEQGGFDDEMTHFSEALKKALCDLTEHSVMAYVETGYFGGQGDQAAVVYYRGKCVYGPHRAPIGPISEALGLLGVVANASDHDAFGAAGLYRHRSNGGWIEEGQ
jgi:hypothetical protein